MSTAEFIFGCVGCVATLIGSCVAIQSWRKRRRVIQAAKRADCATRNAFAQVGANAAWARGEAPNLCACETELSSCPRCGELICLECEDWRRHHGIRGWARRNWRRYVSKWFVP